MIERIICIDDDEICLMIEEMVIKQSAITKEIILMNNAPDALTLLNNFHLLDKDVALEELATLIFLDLNMPGMDGFAFLDMLKTNYSNLSEKLKIVILSSSIDAKDISKSFAYKTVIDFISKPLTTDALQKLKGHFNIPVQTE